MEPAEAVLRFLESVSRRSETDFYLKLFRALPKERFAAICVDASVARHAAEAVVLDLRFLAALGLSPVVVLGLHSTGEAEEHAARIRRRLAKAEVPARAIAADDPELFERAADAARRGEIPIIAFRDDAFPSADLRVDRLGALLTALATRKLIFLHRRGALHGSGGAQLPIVNLTTDYDALLGSRELSKKERLLVAWSRRLVFDEVPHKLLVAVTSPFDLLRELFTEKGAGTLLRRGAVIERRSGPDAGERSLASATIDVERLRALLEKSFGRAVRPEFFTRPCSRLYIEEGYRGAALLIDTPLGAYLTKFAVEREAQGEGMGRDLWALLAADHPTLFWRARPGNPIGDWYRRLCDGFVRLPEWEVYFRGLLPADIPRAIDFAVAQPVDIAPPAAAPGPE